MSPRKPPRQSAENSKRSAKRGKALVKAAPAKGDYIPPKGKGKPRGKPYPPGVSGNPGGRPRSVKEAQEQASTYVEEAIEKLAEVMRVPLRVTTLKEIRQAASTLLDRACGRPAQPLTGREGAPLETEFPDLLAALKKLNGDEPDPEPAGAEG